MWIYERGTPLQVSLAVFVVTFTVWFIYRYNSVEARALRAFPRPSSTLFILGNTFDLLKKNRHRIHDWFYDECMRNKGKPWLLTALGRPQSLVLSKEEHFEDVLRHQFSVFEKGPTSLSIAKDMFGEGIFAVDGEKWSHQRKTASALFSHKSMRDVMEKTIIGSTTELLSILQAGSDNNNPLELKLLMDALTTDVFTQIGFGVHPHCLSGKGTYDQEFLLSFTRCAQAVQYRVQQPVWLWKLKRSLNVGSERQFAKDLAVVNDKIYGIISESMDRRSDQAHDGTTERTDLISLLLDPSSVFGDASDVQATPEMIRDMALNTIAAGRGTTAQSLAWFFVSMNQHPDVQRGIRDELAREVPSLVNGTQMVATRKDVQKLVYLEAALRESMRLYPAAPMNGRTANKSTTLSDGTFVPKGTRVVLPTYATARMPWMWGEDATEYKPERWLVNGKLKHISPFKFLVFHAGPRTCPGAGLAMLEMKIVLASIMSKFQLETLRDAHQVEYDLSISLPIKGDLLVNVHPIVVAEKSVTSLVEDSVAHVA